MDKLKNGPASVDEYIAQFPPQTQELLQSLRAVVRETASDASESISYQMPAYKLNGPLVYFAAFKNHIGFFPTSEGMEAFLPELAQYKTSKGTIQFPYNKPIPFELVKRVVTHRIEENTRNSSVKKDV